MNVRDATEADLPAIRALYNALIPTTTVAWTEELETAEERAAWFAEQQRLGFAQVARMPEVGHEFGRWLDHVLLQRLVDP